ncbi:hypothetical protein B0A55_05117 [Friedmanniomyces simplex]|uniref:Uncharacterized protein n=1 Tax=Friedmanniomyces simplex TaxID=329884 RepID=A0A4U0XKH4_9PEZI|nr:hypothetical protein B0A55_05117 [Friedmanniomyces simplex]
MRKSKNTNPFPFPGYILFEHTRRIRSGDRTLLIEAPKKEKNFAWYRKRDRSTSRVRKVGILETRRVV